MGKQGAGARGKEQPEGRWVQPLGAAAWQSCCGLLPYEVVPRGEAICRAQLAWAGSGLAGVSGWTGRGACRGGSEGLESKWLVVRYAGDCIEPATLNRNLDQTGSAARCLSVWAVRSVVQQTLSVAPGCRLGTHIHT